MTVIPQRGPPPFTVSDLMDWYSETTKHEIPLEQEYRNVCKLYNKLNTYYKHTTNPELKKSVFWEMETVKAKKNKLEHQLRTNQFTKASIIKTMENHRDAYMTSCQIVLNLADAHQLPHVRTFLETSGCTIDNVDEANGVIDVTGESHLIHGLKKSNLFAYVRDVMCYIADFPPGDPRDLDGPQPAIKQPI